MSDRTLVIYHGNCFDGFTAAWAVREHFRHAEYVPAVYPPRGEDTALPDCAGRDVVMVDFCVTKEQLLRLKAEAKSLLVLDHHKSHQEACDGLDFCTFDMDRSGAGLAWDWLETGTERPWLVDYVEDRDLWRFKLEFSREVNAYIQCQEMSFEAWDAMAILAVEEAAQLGRGALAYLDRYVRDMKREARTVFLSGHRVQCVNAPYIGTSELVGALAEDSQTFACGWFQRADGNYQYSLRSRGDFDVSAVAKTFGGGGHAQAAGFTVPVRVHTDSQQEGKGK